MGSTSPINPSLPTILCLHGGGTNSTIFKIQLVRLTRMLTSTFNFIYVNAPFESPPGPGVLPMFDGCGPFTRWMSSTSDELLPEVKELIDDAIEDCDSKIVGVLGFSQGAKLAAGLLLEQQVKERDSAELVAGDEGFRFGVFLNAVCPPLLTKELKEKLGPKPELIRTPGVHVLGHLDRWADDSRRLYEESFDLKKNRLLEFNIGHRLPALEADTRRIADEILRLHRETSIGGF